MISINWQTGRANFSAARKQSHWEIHWDDGVISQVRRQGKMWDWGRTFKQSSHLAGIASSLIWQRENGELSGKLRRVPNK